MKKASFKTAPEIQNLLNQTAPEIQQIFDRVCNTIDQLSYIGAALSAERNLPKLLQMILEEARKFTNADGGTLYMVNDDEQSMRFEIVQTNSLNIRMGGTSGNPIDWYPVKLYLPDGEPNHAMVSAHVGLTGEIVNIPDVYDVEGFDFAGTRAFDSKTGYRSKSMLVVPLRNHEDEIIGVLQLLNALDPVTDETVPFSSSDQDLIISLASQAAVAVTNARLIHDLQALLDAFIKSIASAIDEKSPYTGGHIERVAELTMTIAEKLAAVDYGPYSAFGLNDDELNELKIAAWMHDIGKITTPEYVVDKSTKLETIFDRIEVVKARIEILKRDAKIKYLEAKLNQDTKPDQAETEYNDRMKLLDETMAFLTNTNIGGEFMPPEKQEQVRQLAKEVLSISEESVPLLSEEEIKNLCIARGTLTNEERQIIMNHVSITIKMLDQLPFPKKLRRVPEFAGGHHELDGSGYPNHLTEEQLSPQAKIMALADIFEALTAKDRPYKKGKTLSQAMRIMGFMAKDKHIDPELFRIFVKEKIYLDYANKNMDASQIDEINEEDYLK